MCTIIRTIEGPDIETVGQFQTHFGVDAKAYALDGVGTSLDECLCNIDLDRFFADHPEHEYHPAVGDWWEGKDDSN